MNCSEAKKIRIVDFLLSLGINPTRIKNGAAWYYSPLRTEREPSFKVNINKNVWSDFGSGTGGNILDLVMVLNNTDLSGALKNLQSPARSATSFFSFDQQETEPASIEIKHVQPLQNRALIQYLDYRKISFRIASQYVQEAYYQVKDKKYFSLAFKNDKGGYELRNKHFKGSNSPKYITTLPENNSRVNIFEGFIDFLSALTHFKLINPSNTTIILNSTSNLPYAEHLIKSAKEIYCFLDNDETGFKVLSKVRELNSNVINQAAKIYPGFNDFNDFICNKPHYERN